MISERVLQARMAEVGRIKIGGLDETVRKNSQGKQWQMPKKFDHFVITGMERDEKGNFLKDDALHSIVGDTPRELKIRLLYNDIELNFRTELAFYQGKTCMCRGDGEKAQRLDKSTGELLEVACPCPKLQQEKYPCKPHGVLHCLLEDASLCGGVHKFATTSWNTIRSITSSLKFIQTCTGGKLAGLPLTLKYFKKATQTRAGQATTIPVVTIVYEGNPVQMLESAISTERKRIEAGIQLETLEAQVRREMKSVQLIAGPLDDEEIPEFHPEGDEAGAEEPALTIDQVAGAPEKEKKPDPEPNPKPAKTEKKPHIYAYLCTNCNNIECAERMPESCKKCGKYEFEEHVNLESARKNITDSQKTDSQKTWTCPDCGRTSKNPGSCKCSATPKASEKTNSEPSDPQQPQQPSEPQLTKTQAQSKIVSLRARNRINGDDFESILKTVGLKNKPADWSAEDANAVLAALEAKYAKN